MKKKQKRNRSKSPIVTTEHFNTAKDICNKIVRKLKENHPRLKYSMRTKNVLLYLGHDDKLLTPYKSKLIIDKRYEKLIRDLKVFKESSFMTWVVGK